MNRKGRRSLNCKRGNKIQFSQNILKESQIDREIKNLFLGKLEQFVNGLREKAPFRKLDAVFAEFHKKRLADKCFQFALLSTLQQCEIIVIQYSKPIAFKVSLCCSQKNKSIFH